MTQVDVDMMEEELKLESAYRLAGYETMQRNLQQAKENSMVDTATPIGQAFFTHKLLAVKDTIGRSREGARIEILKSARK